MNKDYNHYKVWKSNVIGYIKESTFKFWLPWLDYGIIVCLGNQPRHATLRLCDGQAVEACDMHGHPRHACHGKSRPCHIHTNAMPWVDMTHSRSLVNYTLSIYDRKMLKLLSILLQKYLQNDITINMIDAILIIYK